MKTTARLRHFLCIASSALLAISHAHADILYYDGGTANIGGTGNSQASGTTGNWNTALLNWDAGPSAYVGWNNTNNDIAFFGAGSAFSAPTPGTVTLTSAITVGGIIFNTSGYTITGNTLTFGGTNNTVALNNLVTAATISSAIGTSTANMTFTAQNPIGAATITFGAAGGWTGTTQVNAGVTLQLNSASTALLNTSGIILNGGTITQNYVAVVDRIKNDAPITSYGGTFGTNNPNTAGNYTETIGAVTLERGLTTFVHTAAPGNLTTQNLILTSLTRTGASNTSTVNFGGPGGMAASGKNRITVTGATQTTAGQIIGPWATAGNTSGASDYAIYGTGGSVLNADATLVAGGEGTWTAATDAYNNNVVTQTLGATRTITALRNTAAAATLTLASGFNLETYGVLNGESNMFTVAPGTGGVLTTPTGGGYLYLNAGNGTTGGSLRISAPVTDNGGTVSVVKSGLGTLNLTGTNTFKGGIVVNSGSVVVTPTSANTFATGAAGADIINGGSLTYSSANAWGGANRNTTFNGTGTLTSSVAYTGGTLTVNSGANAVIANTGNLVYATTTGTGAIIHTPGNSSSLLNLGNASGFTGDLQNRGTAGGTATGIQFSNLGDGGALQFAGGNSNGDQAATFTYNGTSALNFGTRQIQILERVSGNNDFRDNILVNNSADAAHTWTIGTDLLATGGRANTFNATGAAILILSGTNTGNNAFNGVISDGQYGSVVANGNIAVTKSGTGASSKWILGGNNTYSGATAVSVGILNIQHANALGSTASGTSVANAAVLQIQGGITTAAEALTLTPGGGGTAMLLNVSGTNIWSGSVTSNTATNTHVSRIQSDLGKLTLAGAVNLTGSAHQLVFQGDGALEVSGQITGVGRITGSTNGAGLRTLSNDSNSYTGATSANGGTIAFTSIGNVGAVSSALGAPVLADATINVGSAAVAGTLRYVGTAVDGHTSDRLINLAGGTGGATIEANGTDALVLTGGVTAAGGGVKTLTLRGTNTDNNSIAAIGQASVPSQVSVTKEDSGTWVLTGTSTYTGATTVNAGTLLVNGSLNAASAVTVATTAALGGSGTIAGTVGVTGILAPGIASVSGGIGTLAAGNTTWNGGTDTAATIWQFDLSANSNASDTLAISGNFNMDSTAGSFYKFNFMSSAPTTWGNVYTLVTWTGSTQFTNANQFSWSNLGGAYDLQPGTGFTLTGVGGNTGGNLTFTAVPEPTSALAGLLITAGLLRRRRASVSVVAARPGLR